LEFWKFVQSPPHLNFNPHPSSKYDTKETLKGGGMDGEIMNYFVELRERERSKMSDMKSQLFSLDIKLITIRFK